MIGTTSPFWFNGMSPETATIAVGLLGAGVLVILYFHLCYWEQFQKYEAIVYVTFGTLCVLCAFPGFRTLSRRSFMIWLLGDIMYLIGVPFFMSWLPYMHAIFHTTVVAGSYCHYRSVFQ
jgi:hemolysin III